MGKTPILLETGGLLKEHLIKLWPLWARAHQVPELAPWTNWLFLGGRGAGKTRAGAEWVRGMALGADTVSSARAMMLALGCIQSRSCNTDHCPTGIATQNPYRNAGLVVTNKAKRVANFHEETVKNLVELVGAAGLDGLAELGPEHINRRVQGTDVRTYAELYPVVEIGCLLADDTIPEKWRDDWRRADTGHW